MNSLRLLLDAAKHYESSPMLHYIELAIIKVEADLRKYWGESDTHRPMIRRQFEAVLRCARMHRNNGSNLVASEFFRQARELAERERQYFTDAEIADLGRSMQEAIHAGIAGAEKHVVRGSNHSTIFDNTAEHNRVVIDFFQRHSAG